MRWLPLLGLLACAPAARAVDTTPHDVPDAKTTAAAVAPPPTDEVAPLPDPASAAEPEPQSQAATACITDRWQHATTTILREHEKPIAQRLGRRPTSADLEDGRCFSEEPLQDLDGDGRDDTAWVEGCSWGTYAALHLIYLSGGGCARFAGAIVDGSPVIGSPASPPELPALIARQSNGCAGHDFAWSRYEWDGERYVKADEARCYFCPDDPPPPDANTHPVCIAEANDRAGGP